MLPFDDKLVPVRRDKFNVHGIRAFTAAELVFFNFCHLFTAQSHTLLAISKTTLKEKYNYVQ